ncbi:MAG: ribosomal-protein-alanine N-acetyltransferase [Patiriisocius sp.]|jgi:ribosomal-protein-alanine N-acetyltransferase
MHEFVPLSGERIIVRDWRVDELEGMHRWLGNPQVRKFLSFGTSSIDESAAHLRDVIDSQKENPREHYYLAIELKESGMTIGDAGFSWKGKGIAEIGYFLEPDYWGKGFATEAAKMMITFAFGLGADQVLASCDVENADSEMVMRRCGMEKLESDDPDRLLYGTRQ